MEIKNAKESRVFALRYITIYKKFRQIDKMMESYILCRLLREHRRWLASFGWWLEEILCVKSYLVTVSKKIIFG